MLFGYIFGTSSYPGGTATKQIYVNSSFETYYIPASLKNVVITGGAIRYNVFQNCTGLTGVEIRSGVTGIWGNAFAGCSGLTSMTLPFVGDSRTAATGRQALFGYIFGENSYTGGTETKQVYGTGVNDSPTFYIPTTLKSVVITDTTQLGYGAFSSCRGLTSIGLPGGLTSIGDKAFQNCKGLTDIEIPGGLTSIGADAFRGCSELMGIEIPDSVKSIGEGAFSSCSKLTTITFGANSQLTSIGASAFWGSDELTRIVIPIGVTSIGANAFRDCGKLTIYARVTEANKPNGWVNNWNFSACQVEWGYTGE
ncbi:hypothetical protein FACS1894211_16180 [Clostridia bacterium]|nr:hypothetical protein FACS1894211_16180 [Clostridia bacterium]